MKQTIRGYVHDTVFCFKLSLKLVFIPIIIGALSGIIYLLSKGQSIELTPMLLWVRNTGIIFSCIGLFICALGFLQPTMLLRPLSYQKTWRKYLNNFGLVGTI
ncbi:MAG: hypothetical protein RR128_09655, partial [Clostridium sp.]